MQVDDYQLSELHFAYCYHAFLHWRTHRRQPYPQLIGLIRAELHALAEPRGIHVLDCDSRPVDLRALVSLRPAESLSACASKLKGQVSKWLRQHLGPAAPGRLLARGYFACTSGKSTAAAVEAYLEGQSAHHGYQGREVPPGFTCAFPLEEEGEPWWQAEHAFTRLQFHVVLATWGRRGVFARDEANAVTQQWRAVQRKGRFALRKVSFVPDHVHIAVWLHPAVAPAEVVVRLMNEGQRVVVARIGHEMVRAGVGRLWQASAYVGSYGDLATAQVQKYLERWQGQE